MSDLSTKVELEPYEPCVDSSSKRDFLNDIVNKLRFKSTVLCGTVPTGARWAWDMLESVQLLRAAIGVLVPQEPSPQEKALQETLRHMALEYARGEVQRWSSAVASWEAFIATGRPEPEAAERSLAEKKRLLALWAERLAALEKTDA